jgi:hypothetical protein
MVIVIGGGGSGGHTTYSTDTHAQDDELKGPHLLCARTQPLIDMTNEGGEKRRRCCGEYAHKYSSGCVRTGFEKTPATPARSHRRKTGNERAGGAHLTRALESVYLGPDPVFSNFSFVISGHSRRQKYATIRLFMK